MTLLLAANTSFLNPCEDANVHTYSTTSELKKDIYGKYSEHETSLLYVFFEPLIGWEYAYVCHDLRSEKQSIYSLNSKNIKQAISVQETFIWEIKLQNYNFNKIWPFFIW